MRAAAGRDRGEALTAWRGGVLYTGGDGWTPVTGHTIFTEDGRILAILPSLCDNARTLERKTPAERMHDLQGRYMMPGLINLHVHLNSGGRPAKKKMKPGDYIRLVHLASSNPVLKEAALRLTASHAKTLLMSGVTTIRTMGGIADLDTRIRDRILAGRLTGPRVLACNTGISVPGGHVAGSLAYPARSVSEAVDCVDRIASESTDLVKLMITGGIMDAERRGEPGALKMPPEMVRAACDRAHHHGLPVAAHVESPAGMIAALENGVDTIEHGALCPTGPEAPGMSADGEAVRTNARIMELFHETGASLVTTLSPVVPLSGLDPAFTHMREMDRYNSRVVLDGIAACARQCLEEGIPVGLGTDTGCPYVTQYDTWRELAYFHSFLEVTEQKALETATAGNARIAGIYDRTGSLEPGKSADLLILGRDPVRDLTALRDPEAVVARGILYDRPEIRRYPEIDTQLDTLYRKE